METSLPLMGLDEKLLLGMCFAFALFITLCAKYRLLFFRETQIYSLSLSTKLHSKALMLGRD